MKLLSALLLLLITGCANAQVAGCTDPLSQNYDPDATVNDGSCTYASSSVAPVTSVDLPAEVAETSGLIMWNGRFYTHNDNTDLNIYGLNLTTGGLEQTLTATGVSNQDWEEIQQDDNYIYIGDFGNNVNGNRTNLRIIRIEKASLVAGTPVANSINFSYSNQTDFTPTGSNNSDFDCEAFVVGEDNIYLFTKQWVSRQTAVYKLPKTPGTHVAQLQSAFNVDGLITGALWLEWPNVAVLCGYSATLQPFTWLLYDFEGDSFFGGNKRRVGLSLGFHQVEGITTTNGTDYYLTNEHFAQPPFVDIPQRLHHVDMEEYLGSYLESLSVKGADLKEKLLIYPNPIQNVLCLEAGEELEGAFYTVTDALGKEVLKGKLAGAKTVVDTSALAAGVYNIRVGGFSGSYKVVK